MIAPSNCPSSLPIIAGLILVEGWGKVQVATR